MTRVDLDCPQCGGTVWVTRTSEDQTAACDECGQPYDVFYDSSQEPDRLATEEYNLSAHPKEMP